MSHPNTGGRLQPALTHILIIHFSVLPSFFPPLHFTILRRGMWCVTYITTSSGTVSSIDTAGPICKSDLYLLLLLCLNQLKAAEPEADSNMQKTSLSWPPRLQTAKCLQCGKTSQKESFPNSKHCSVVLKTVIVLVFSTDKGMISLDACSQLLIWNGKQDLTDTLAHTHARISLLATWHTHSWKHNVTTDTWMRHPPSLIMEREQEWEALSDALCMRVMKRQQHSWITIQPA